jgi:hypothetical protein
MTAIPQRLDASRPRCHLAATFAQIFEQSMLRRITETTTPEEFHTLQQSLMLLCLELEQQADWRHYQAAGTLRHCCVRDTYTQAAFILKNISLTQSAPPAPPAPPPPRETLADVLRDLKESLQQITMKHPLALMTNYRTLSAPDDPAGEWERDVDARSPDDSGTYQ